MVGTVPEYVAPHQLSISPGLAITPEFERIEPKLFSIIPLLSFVIPLPLVFETVMVPSLEIRLSL